MNINTVNENVVTRKATKRLGRGKGSGQGKTGGRGHKGDGSRAGSSVSSYFEGGQMPLVRRVPKRGFNNKAFADKVEAVTVVDVLSRFGEPCEITPALLFENGLIDSLKSYVKLIGDLDEETQVPGAYVFKIHAVSAGSRALIEAAGGSFEILPGKKKVVKNKMGSKKKQK